MHPVLGMDLAAEWILKYREIFDVILSDPQVWIDRWLV